jgi:hypothetical protein
MVQEQRLIQSEHTTRMRHMPDHRFPTPVQSEDTSLQTQPSRLFIEHRLTPRVATRGGLGSFMSLLGPAAEGDAMLLNISLQGCQLDSEQAVPKDHPYQLILYAPPHPTPIVIRKAATRWSEGSIYGISFVDLAPDCQLKLKEAIRNRPVMSWVMSSIQFGIWSAR